MESHMQELLICGWFILNDGQSQAPSFDPMHTTMYIETAVAGPTNNQSEYVFHF